MRKIIIAGGCGFLGRHVNAHLSRKGFDVLVLSRKKSGNGIVHWDAKTLGSWSNQLDGSHALINLVGRSVDCRYNRVNKAEILSSRIDSTRVLGQAISECRHAPRFWINSSTATIYEHTAGDSPANTESKGAIGDDFSMNVAKAWEQELLKHHTPNTNKTALRTAIVLGADGGALPVMTRLARFGLCSSHADGQQWISWLHISDFCRAVEFLLENPLEGAVNLCSPEPIRNAAFNQLLRERTKPFFVLPQPRWLLEVGAFFVRTETELILKSRKVFPERLVQSGFEFEFPAADSALDDLLSKRY